MIENQIHKTIELSEDILNQIKIDKELKNDLEKVMIKKPTKRKFYPMNASHKFYFKLFKISKEVETII